MDKIQECADNFLRLINTTSYISPQNGPQNNSFIKCDYIIESQLKDSHTIVYIFIKHRCGADSPCGIISFVVKKNVSYGGRNLYWMIKDKIVNGVRRTLYQNPQYALKQKSENESTINYNGI